MRYRKTKKSDGNKYLKLMKKLDQESSFMLYKPKERKTTIK